MVSAMRAPEPVAERVSDPAKLERVFELRGLSAWYGAAQALRNITFDIPKNRVTAIIGPSGCGKSTLIRCLDRMNDLIPGFRAEGHVTYHDEDIYGPAADPVLLRRHIGMVFQSRTPSRSPSSTTWPSDRASTATPGICMRSSRGRFAARSSGTR